MINCSRRDFLKCAGAAGAALTVLDPNELIASVKKSRVALVKMDDHKEGVKTSLKAPAKVPHSS